MHVPTQSDAEKNGSSVSRPGDSPGGDSGAPEAPPPPGPSAAEPTTGTPHGRPAGASHLHGLVIGVDHHDPGRGCDGRIIPDLAGAVSDALRMARYLREGPLAVPEERVRTLISPSPFSDLRRPAAADLPTYRNIVAAIEELAETAAPGDQVLIHFSGHGMRVPSAEPAKGRFGRDEALVPCDAGDPDGGVLRDVEMYRLLSRLSDAGLYVTLFLDACHAGGATRAFDGVLGGEAPGGVRVRGLGERGGMWGPPESLCGPWSDLYEAVEHAERAELEPGFRHFSGESGWFPQPERCVLLAACRGVEVASERRWEDFGPAGAFTRCALDRLAAEGRVITYASLVEGVRRRIDRLHLLQTPIIEGDGELQFLGAGRRQESQAPEAARADEERLAVYTGVRELAEPADSPLREALEMRLFELDRKEDWDNPILRRPVPGDRVRAGGLLCLVIHNTSDLPLNFVVFDVRPEGEVERVHPVEREGEYSVVDPGGDHPIFLRPFVPDGSSEIRSVLKVVASADHLVADHLALPPREAKVTASRVDANGSRPTPHLRDGRWTTAVRALSVVA